MRLFVALDLPDASRKRLAGLCCGLPGARWAEPETLHLTLCFLGETDAGWLADLDAALATVRAEPFSLVVSGLGHFGTKRRAHTLWAGVEPCHGLRHLQAKVESAVVRAGFLPDPRNFAPHITLARLHNSPPERLMRFLVGNGLFGCEPILIERFALWISHQGHTGASYEVLESYPFAAAARPTKIFGERNRAP